MSEEITLSGKKYISSKRAAELSGYAQDYIGQLARGGAIDAQRIGGLWYIVLESLNTHREKDEAKTPSRAREHTPAHDQFVAFDGKDYISAGRAAELTGYNQDYVGQLARSGKILSRQVGGRWYVERSGILAHKEQKDALLAAVQTESVGLPRFPRHDSRVKARTTESVSSLRYLDEQSDLIPKLVRTGANQVVNEPVPALVDGSGADSSRTRPIPIRVVRAPRARAVSDVVHGEEDVRVHGKTIYKAALSVSALTVVVVLSFGMTFFGVSAMYAATPSSEDKGSTMIAAVAGSHVGEILERLVTTELVYIRK